MFVLLVTGLAATGDTRAQDGEALRLIVNADVPGPTIHRVAAGVDRGA